MSTCAGIGVGEPTGREAMVSRAFVAMADTLVDDFDVIELVDRLVGYSVALLAADAAAIMLGDDRAELQVLASSSHDAELMELLALRADEGPCLECFQTGAPVSVPDLADTVARWPSFVAAVSRRERNAFRSVHALPLRLRGQPIGVLTLFHRTPGALPAADLVLGQALADVATIGILSERSIRRHEVLAEQLQGALNSRIIIEQAKGVLAQGSGLGMDGAFERMRQYARRHNKRLAQIARTVVEGRLDLATVIDSGSAPGRVPASTPAGSARPPAPGGAILEEVAPAPGDDTSSRGPGG